MPIDLSTTTRPSGETIWATSPPIDAIEIWRDASGYKAMSPADFYTVNGVTSPKTSVRNVFNGSRTITPDFFNLHIYNPASIGVPSDIEYAGIRIHDLSGPVNGSGLRWHNIHTGTGAFGWSNLDAVVDPFYAAGKTLLYMAVCTPNWCSSTTPNSGKYDNGTTFMASNQPPSVAGKTEWAAFATALATRYNGSTHGLIDTYEVWNEVNYTSYWTGTHAQYAELLRLFRNALRAVNASIKVGAPTIQEPESTGSPWLTTFLAASDGAAGTGKDHMDYAFIHLYPPKYNFGLAWSQVDAVRTILDAAGKTTLDIWNTETGVLFDPQRTISDTWKAKVLKRTLALCAAKGVKRYYWYTYDNPDMMMTSAEKNAWAEIRGVLLSGAITNCNILPDERVCITIGGQEHTF